MRGEMRAFFRIASNQRDTCEELVGWRAGIASARAGVILEIGAWLMAIDAPRVNL